MRSSVSNDWNAYRPDDDDLEFDDRFPDYHKWWSAFREELATPHNEFSVGLSDFEKGLPLKGYIFSHAFSPMALADPSDYCPEFDFEAVVLQEIDDRTSSDDEMCRSDYEIIRKYAERILERLNAVTVVDDDYFDELVKPDHIESKSEVDNE